MMQARIFLGIFMLLSVVTVFNYSAARRPAKNERQQSSAIIKRAKTIADVREYVKNNSNVVTFFYRTSCPYSLFAKPLFETAARAHVAAGDPIVFVAIDITRSKENFKQVFDFATVPLFAYFRDGMEQTQYRHGSNDKHLKQSEIEAIIRKLYF